jgi:hypothetical protein
VCDLEKLLCREREKVPDPFYYLEISLSLPKDGLQSIDDLNFNTLFEQTLFKCKSETNLDDIVFDMKRFRSLIPNKILQAANLTQNISQIPNPPRAMAARFTPLSLPAQLHNFPQNYNQRIKLYDTEGNTSTQNHLDWFNDFVDIKEVDHEDANMRLFMQIISEEVRKWFKALLTASIPNFAEFETSFIARWGEKKNPLQLLT